MELFQIPALPDRPHVVDLSFAPDGRRVACCFRTGHWAVVDVVAGRVLEAGTLGGAARRVRFSPDGRHVAIATASHLHIWRTDPWLELGSVDTGQDAQALGFTPDGATAIVFGGGHVVGMSGPAFVKGKPTRRFINGRIVFVSIAALAVIERVDPRLPRTGIARQNFSAIAISPDGQRVAWLEGSTLLVGDARTGEPHWTAVAGAGGGVAFSADGTAVAVGGYGQLGIWDAITGRRRRLIHTDGDAGSGIAFSPDGHTLSVPSRADHVDLWWVDDASLRGRLPAAAVVIGTPVVFSPDGTAIAFGTVDGAVGLAPVRPARPPLAVEPASLLGDVPSAHRQMAEHVLAVNGPARFQSGPPPIDLARFTAFAPLAQVAVRLHPRRVADVDARTSHVGGPVLWPEGKPWPICPDHGEPMAVVAQLSRADVPELPFPNDSDLCQLFWCERAHGVRRHPRAAVRWRMAATDLSARFAPAALSDDSAPAWRPVVCGIWPERVIDYPGDYDVDAATAGEFARIEAAHPELADYGPSLGAAPGFKVGGYPRWVQDPEQPACATCGQPMRLLLQADGWEYDGSSRRRWQPAEPAPASNDERLARIAPTMPSFGDGVVFIFACLDCTPHLVDAVFQR
jgi:hypothetical protein